MAELFPVARKRAIGFMIIDATSELPLATSGSGLLVQAKDGSFYRIAERAGRCESRRTPAQRGYRYTHRKAEQAIERHRRTLRKLRSSGLTDEWERVKTAQQLSPKIKTVYST